VEFTRRAFPPALLENLGVLLCQFLSGVTVVGKKFKERGRAVPIDFDGNWPEMDLRPTSAPLHSVGAAPRSLGLGLPRVVAFLLLLLFNCPNSNSEAALFFLGAAETPPAAIRHENSEIQSASGVLVAVDGPVARYQILRADLGLIRPGVRSWIGGSNHAG
jgi:hypothetical protein